MKPLFDINKLNEFSPHDKLPLECNTCKEIFFSVKKEVRKVLNNHKTVKLINCSRSCAAKYKTTKQKVDCMNCGKSFEKILNQIKKSRHNFCSRSCSTTYYNKNKTHGTNRSKLEVWLEEQLKSLYPKLDIDFNGKEVIGSELDIHIPSLNLAFELNGIFHYEPIFGVDKLERSQINDKSKMNECFKKKIDLCVIDTSQQKYFKPKTSQKYLDIITQIINQRTIL